MIRPLAIAALLACSPSLAFTPCTDWAAAEIEVRDQFPPIACPALLAETGNPLLAVLTVAAGVVYMECTAIGPGRAIIVVALAGPDALLGHAARHALDEHHDFHPPGLPFIDTECPQQTAQGQGPWSAGADAPTAGSAPAVTTGANTI